MPRRKTLSSDSSPPATNQSPETTTAAELGGAGSGSGGRANKRRKTSVSGSSVDGNGVKDNAADDNGAVDRPERPQRQTRSSSNAQPTSRKASILSRAATAPDNVSSAAATTTPATTAVPSSLSLSSTSRASPVLVAALAKESQPPRTVCVTAINQTLPGNPTLPSSSSSSSSPLVKQESLAASAVAIVTTSPSAAQSWSSVTDVKTVTTISQTATLTSGGVVSSGGAGDFPAEATSIHSLPQYTMTIDPAILDRAQGQLVIVDPLTSEVITQTASTTEEQQQLQQQYFQLPVQEQQTRASFYVQTHMGGEQIQGTSSDAISADFKPIPEIKGELPELHIDVPAASPDNAGGGSSPSATGKPKQIRERRSTRSLEALFQVTDSELQSMQSHPGSNLAVEKEGSPLDPHKYLVLKDVNMMDLPDTAQIFITSSAPAASVASQRVDGTGGLGLSIENVKSLNEVLTVSGPTVASSIRGSTLATLIPGSDCRLAASRAPTASSAVMTVADEGSTNSGAISLGLKDMETITLLMPNSQESNKQPGESLQVLEAVKLMNYPTRPSASPATSLAGINEQLKLVKQEILASYGGSGGSGGSGVATTLGLVQESEGNGKRKQPQQSGGDGKAAKAGKYKCDYCDIVCAKPSVLEKHRRTHTNERPFPCVVCGVSFKTKSNLTKHWKSNSHVSRTGITCSTSTQEGAEAGRNVPEGISKDGGKKEGLVDGETDIRRGVHGLDKSVNSHQASALSRIGVHQDEPTVDRVGALPQAQSAAEPGGVQQESCVEKVDGSQQSSGVSMRQDPGVLEGIRQKIDKNKRQQQEKDWFHRVFMAFDKPSQSELAKYTEIHNLVRPNIIGTVDGQVLEELETLKTRASKELTTLCGKEPQLPVLMTHELLSDDRLRIKILSPRLEYAMGESDSAPGRSQLQERTENRSEVAAGAGSMFRKTEIRRALSSSGGTVLKMLSTPSLHPGLVVKAATDLTSQLEAGDKASLTPATQGRPLLGSHSSDLSADRLSTVLDNSTSKRPKTLSHSGSDLSLSSLPSVFSQSSREIQSVDESGPKGVPETTYPSIQTTSSRRPLLGDSKTTAAFSNLVPSSDSSKRGLVYQHALDAGPSDHPARAQLKERAASLTSMKDFVEDRIQKIINTNAEVVEKSPIVEMPRSKTRYLRQTSDSTGFHTMRLSDLQAQNSSSSSNLKPGDALLASDRLTIKKKLAASLSVGDSSGKDKDNVQPAFLLRPDHLVRRSMSTSAIKAVGSVEGIEPGSSVLAAALTAPSSAVSGPTTSVPDSAEKGLGLMQMEGIVHTLGVSQQADLILLPSIQQNQQSLPQGIGVAQQATVSGQQLELHTSSSLTQSQLAALSKAQLMCFPASAIISSKASLEQTSGSGGMASSSPSGGGIVAVQEDKPEQQPTPSIPSLMFTTQPTSLTPPTKIVQGPGQGEIQIQFQLSQPSDGSRSMSASSINNLSSKPALGTSSRSNSNSSEAPSIISSMLQAPRQTGPIVSQSGIQLSSASRIKPGSPLTSTVLNAASLPNQTQITLNNLGKSSEQLQDISTTKGKAKIGSSGSLHDQKKLMSRQSSAPVVSQATSSQVMSALQQRLSVPASRENQTILKQLSSQSAPGIKGILVQKDQQQQQTSNRLTSGVSPTISGVHQLVSGTEANLSKEDNQIKILTTEHFKSQGLADGLVAAAREYISERFSQAADLQQHQSSGLCSSNQPGQLRRSQSEKQVVLKSYQNNLLSQDKNDAHPKLLFINNSALGAKAATTEHANLLKSLAAPIGTEKSMNEAKSKEQSTKSIPLSSPSTTLTVSQVSQLTGPSAMENSQPPVQEQKQQSQTIVNADNISQTTMRRKKGRPKGSKNRPKDLNLVLAKARGAVSKSLPTGSLDLASVEGGSAAAIKQSLSSQGQAGQFLLVQSGQYPKLLLPRSNSVTAKTQDTSSAISLSGRGLLPSTSALPISSLPISSLQVSSLPVSSQGTTSNNSAIVGVSSSNLIGQPMLPVISNSSNAPTLVAGQWLKTSAANSGKVVFGFPVPGATTGTAPLTPITPTNSGQASNPTQLQIIGQGRVRPDLTLNISSASTVTPRVIPCIPAVTFHSVDSAVYSRQTSEGTLCKDPKTSALSLWQQEVTQQKLTKSTPQSLSQLALTPVTPLTPATPETPPDFAGTRRRLKERILEKQSLSSDRGSIDSSVGPGKLETHIQVTLAASDKKTKIPTLQHHVVPGASTTPISLQSPVGSKQGVTSNNSALLASLTKPVLSSTKLGSLPNAVITSAMMGGKSTGDQQTASNNRKSSEMPSSETLLRVQSEPNGDHPQHSVVLRALSEPAADPVAKFRRHKPYVPSPLSIEYNKSSRSPSNLASKPLTSPSKEKLQPFPVSKTTPTPASQTLREAKALSLSDFVKSKSESGSIKESFDSGLGLRSLSLESGQLTAAVQSPKFFYFSPTLGSMDRGSGGGDTLMIDLSGENFNNVTIPINYMQPYVATSHLQSGPLLASWNHPNRATGMQVSLSPVTLAGSKIVLPSVNNGDNLLRESRNWLMKRSICLHRIFQVPSQLWHSSAPNTLDAMTAMAFALGNPSSTCLIRTLLSRPKNLSMTSGSVGETISSVKYEDGVMKPKSEEFSINDSHKLLGRKAEEAQEIGKGDNSETVKGESSADAETISQVTSSSLVLTSMPELKEAVNIELRARLASLGGRSSLRNLSSLASDSQTSEISTTTTQTTANSTFLLAGTSPNPAVSALQLETPTKGSTFFSSLHPLTPLVGVDGAGQAPAPGSITYGHQCPTLYTCAHVTFCCIQRPQPVYVAMKNNRRVSMYSNWRLATHNPNPVGLTPRMLLSLYRSRSASDPIYSQCMGGSSGGGNQTHSSYWTFQRRRGGDVSRIKITEKSMSTDLNRSSSTELSPASLKENAGNSSSRKHRIKMYRAAMGFKSEEHYEYVRGRGYGKYVCHRCHIRCKKPSMLKKHLRTHTDLRPYHCRHCRFSFKTKGNLTKHMKSKSHQKKCYELGIIPVPTSVDESQIDTVALQEQVRISREATIQDGTAGFGSGDEGDDDDCDEEDDGDDEDMEGGEEDEDEDKLRSLSGSLSASSSFDQDGSGLISPRVLKRQSSIDEASPAFTFGQNQESKYSVQLTDTSQRCLDSVETPCQYQSYSPSKHRATSPNSINAEIARSLQDLALPNKSESKEIVDEAAHRHAQHKLQALISRLMSEKKPLSGLQVSGVRDVAVAPPAHADVAFMQSQESKNAGVSTGEDQQEASPSGAADKASSKMKEEHIHMFLSDSLMPSAKKNSSEKPCVLDVSQSETSPYKERKAEGDQQAKQNQQMSAQSLGRVASEEEDNVFLPDTQLSSLKLSPSIGTVSPASKPRPSHLSLIQAAASETPSQVSNSCSAFTSVTLDKPLPLPSLNLPSPSLLAFLPAYVSSRQTQSQVADQGPIIGQFVRKMATADSIGEPQTESGDKDIALTPSLVLEGQTHPFQFNIPFPGNRQSLDEEEEEEEAPSVMRTHKFLYPIPIVTITGASSGTPSPSFDDSPMVQSPAADSNSAMDVSQDPPVSVSESNSVKGDKGASVLENSATKTLVTTSSAFPLATSAVISISTASVNPAAQSTLSRANITTHTMMQEPLSATSVSSGASTDSTAAQVSSAGLPNIAGGMEKERSLSSETTPTQPPVMQSDSAIASLVHKSALPFLSFTDPSVCKPPVDVVPPTSATPVFSNDPCGFPISRRTRRLSSGKSRFLRRQRSLDDGTAFPTTVFEQPSSQGHGSPSIDQTGTVVNRTSSDRQQVELVKSKSFNHYSTAEVDAPAAVSLSEKVGNTPSSTAEIREEAPEQETPQQTGETGAAEASEAVEIQVGSAESEKEGVQNNCECVFCSKEFSSKEKYQEHLKSRDHIQLLETLGALPAGTFERLQHSEQREASRKAREERKREERRDREQRDVTDNDRDIVGHLQSSSLSLQDTPKSSHRATLTTATRVGASSSSNTDPSTQLLEGQGSNPQSLMLTSTGPGHVKEQVVLKASLGREVHLVRRAHSQIDTTSVSGRQGRPPLLKRKISMPSTTLKSSESATLLSSPHLNEDLRRSLAKRARQGLLAGSSSSAHGSQGNGDWTEPDTETRLVIDEQTASPRSTSSALSTRILTSVHSNTLTSHSPVQVSCASLWHIPKTVQTSTSIKSTVAQALTFASSTKPTPLVSTNMFTHTSPQQPKLTGASRIQSEKLDESQSSVNSQEANTTLRTRPILGVIPPRTTVTELSKEQTTILSPQTVQSAPSSVSGKTILVLPLQTVASSLSSLTPPVMSAGGIANLNKVGVEHLQHIIKTNSLDSTFEEKTLLLSQQDLSMPLSSSYTYSLSPQTSTVYTLTSSISTPTSSLMAQLSKQEVRLPFSPQPRDTMSIPDFGNRQFACGLCELSFPSEQLRKTHVQTHAELRPHVCEFCDAGFTNSRSLRTHLLTHGQDRPYICGNCGDTFANMSDLQTHYSSHSSTSIASSQWKVQTQVPVSQSMPLLHAKDLCAGTSGVVQAETSKSTYQDLSGRVTDNLSQLQQQQILQQLHQSVDPNELIAHLTLTENITTGTSSVTRQDLKLETDQNVKQNSARDNQEENTEEAIAGFAGESMEDYGSDQDESGVTAAWDELTKETGADIFVQEFKVENTTPGYEDDVHEHGDGVSGISDDFAAGIDGDHDDAGCNVSDPSESYSNGLERQMEIDEEP